MVITAQMVPLTDLMKNLGLDFFQKNIFLPMKAAKINPAHPAIYPTGEQPKRKLEVTEFKLFDLIIRRFLATFGDAAKAGTYYSYDLSQG